MSVQEQDEPNTASVTASPERDDTSTAADTTADIEVVDEGARPPVGDRNRRFAAWLTVILLVGLVVRIWCALGPMADRPVATDADNVRVVAQRWVDGLGITEPGQPPGVFVQNAAHVPAHLLVIAGLDKIGLTEPPGQRVAIGLLSLIGVAAMGLLGRRLDRPLVGLVSAGAAAVSPLWFQPATSLMPEGVLLFTLPVALLAAVWCRDKPTWIRLALMGAAIGLVALTRSETILLFVLVALPIAVLSTKDWRGRVKAVAIVTAAFGLVLAPWLIRVHHELGSWALSTNDGITIQGSGCAESFSGPREGAWAATCAIDGVTAAFNPAKNPTPIRDSNAIQLSNFLRNRGLTYERNHLRQLPRVVAIRVGRTWGVSHIEDTINWDVAEDRDLRLQEIGYGLNYVLMALTVVGMVLLSRKQWTRWWILVPPIVITTLASALFGGTPRYRVDAEPSLILFASFALVVGGGRLLAWWRRRRVDGPPAESAAVSG